MNRTRIKLAIGACVFAGAITYLALAGARQAHVYHLTVDQFLSDSQYRTQRVRLCGTVDDKRFFSSPASLTASFVLKGARVELPIEYHGVIPSLFQAGRDVVVEGQLNGQGVFAADVMMTKCASKYESAANGPRDRLDAPNASSKLGNAS
jgi:cytochrome c-type biogenesis protein CcmE